MPLTQLMDRGMIDVNHQRRMQLGLELTCEWFGIGLA